MPAYLVGVVNVTDPNTIVEYQQRVPAVVKQYGGRYLVRGGESDVLEGEPPGSRFVTIEFPDRAAVRRFYDSPEYQEIVGIRTSASTGFLVAVDGA